MDDNIKSHISKQSSDREPLLTEIHEIIVANDKTVTPTIEPMMGKEMIIYKARGAMKYGLSSVKAYMSLHLLPIYGSPTLHAKYSALLPNASFQKGCINFKSAEEMPTGILKKLIIDCARIDLVKIREEYLAAKKKKNKAGK